MQEFQLEERAKDEASTEEALLESSIRSLRDARTEVTVIGSAVVSQGELIGKIQDKIRYADKSLKMSGKKLTELMRTARRRRMAAATLLLTTSIGLIVFCSLRA